MFLSSAAVSVMILLLGTLAVTQYDEGAEEPRLLPPLPESPGGVAENPRAESATGLAATERAEF